MGAEINTSNRGLDMSGNTMGTVAKIGVPLALTAISGGTLAPLMAPALGETAAGALAGALAGGVGSAITGGNPLTGAALGGVGGGISGSGALNGLMGGADTGTAAAANGVNPGIGQGFNAAGDSVAINSPSATSFGTSAPGVLSSTTPSGAAIANSSSPSGIGGFLSRNALPIAGGLAVLATSNNGKPSAAPVGDNRQANDITPLQRTQQATNPQAYYGVGGARQAFDVVNPTVNPNLKYYASGGSVQDKSDRQRNLDSSEMVRARMSGHPMEPQANFVIDKYQGSGYPGSVSEYMGDQYGNVPITREIQSYESSVPRGYAAGGSALYQKAKGPSGFKQGAFHLAAGGMPQMPQGIGSMVQGQGDGQSDQIPAMLSDGEYVMPAPVVSALGRGSNAAGAKKLDKAKAHIMAKTYKGARPPAARMGLGAMGMA